MLFRSPTLCSIMEYLEAIVDSTHSPPHSRSQPTGHTRSASNYRTRSLSPLRPRPSQRSFWGLRKSTGNGASASSVFGRHSSSSSSYYRRSPRPNYLTRLYKKLRRLLRDLIYYIQRHPLKVFTLVILPLITSGALATLLAKFGVRLPPSIQRALSLAAGKSGDPHHGHGKSRTKLGWYRKTEMVLGGLGGVGGIIGLAKLFK